MQFAKTVKVNVIHQPEYFNHTCNATIPEKWQAEVVSGIKPAGRFDMIQVYTMGDTENEVIQDIIQQLKKLGFAGKIKVV